MKQKLSDMRQRAKTFFACNGEAINQRNRALMRLLSLLYLSMLVSYYAVTSLVFGMHEQDLTLWIAIGVQVAFCVFIFAVKRPVPGVAVQLSLLFFGGCIMAMGIIVGTVIFKDIPAALFPLFLIMMSEFYVLSIWTFSALIFVPYGLFLLLSFLNKPLSLFREDAVTATVALTIAMVSYALMLWQQVQLWENTKQLEHIGAIDSLTGISNRKAFLDAFAAFSELECTEPYALAVMDIDSFKSINDTHGHNMGDAVLCDLCKVATLHFGDGTLFARFGGDEFLLLFREAGDPEQLCAKADRFCRDVREGATERGVPQYACSMGLAILPGNETDFDRAFGAADKALYRAKETYRSQVSLSILTETKS